MNCLLCYKPLASNEIDYHIKCVSTIFELKQMPDIDIDEKKLVAYAKKIVAASTTITGVQPKLSLWLEESKKNNRFTIVDNKSNYIIKPQSETYKSLPENEDLCMHLAEELGIETATHGLIRLQSGSLAYITKRFERNGNYKLACEDLCQLTETLTEHKDRGSYEKIGKAIRMYSTKQGLDILNYYQLVLFSFISGNADMHLKNFSMLEKAEGEFCLSPAYDLVSTLLVIKNDPEQMMLTLNGRKNKITKKDFDLFGKSLSLTAKQIQNVYQNILSRTDNIYWWVNNSFLPIDHKILLTQVLSTRIKLFSDQI